MTSHQPSPRQTAASLISARGRMLALAGVLLLLGAAETAREMADTEPGGSVASDLGYALAEALLEMYILAGGLW